MIDLPNFHDGFFDGLWTSDDKIVHLFLLIRRPKSKRKQLVFFGKASRRWDCTSCGSEPNTAFAYLKVSCGVKGARSSLLLKRTAGSAKLSNPHSPANQRSLLISSAGPKTGSAPQTATQK
jgi:hypothetical protein